MVEIRFLCVFFIEEIWIVNFLYVDIGIKLAGIIASNDGADLAKGLL